MAARSRNRSRRLSLARLFFGTLLVIAMVRWCTADPPEASPEPPTDQDDAQPAVDPAANPYLAADGLTPEALVRHVERLRNKPRTIRLRPEFSVAVLDAVDRVIATADDPKLEAVALRLKMEQLHENACLGDANADPKLIRLADEIRGDAPGDLVRMAEFVLLEGRALASGALPPDQLAPLLDEIREYFKTTKPGERHLRLASATVRVINRLPDDKEAEKAYAEFGSLFATSLDRELARYGRRIRKAAEEAEEPPQLVGQTLELEGNSVEGLPLDWASYRGKVVLVDFWATWCPPCVAEVPELARLHAVYRNQGFDIVGISLDTEREALQTFLAENQINWLNLFEDGKGWKNPLALKYGVRSVPCTLLVDRDGKVVAQDIRGEALAEKLKELLGAPPEKPAADSAPTSEPDEKPKASG